MKLYGSTTSPYVRRTRIVLFNTSHEFIDLQIFSNDDRALLAARNPTMKVPCLEDDGRMIFDSRIIFNYLSEKLMLNPLTWEEENQLTLIDAANDSFVQLLLLQRSDVDVEADKLFFSLQKERINSLQSHRRAEDEFFFKCWPRASANFVDDTSYSRRVLRV